jgi:hypothetical protein
MSTTTSKPSKAVALARVQALIAGTEKYFPNGSFLLGNVVYTTASLLALLQGVADAILSLNAAQAQAKDALTALQGIDAHAAPVVGDYRRFLLAAFGGATLPLAEFGMQPLKAKKPLDSEQRVLMTAKIRATRKARGTTSKKQKLAIKGNVVGVVLTPVTTAGSPQEVPTSPPGFTSPAATVSSPAAPPQTDPRASPPSPAPS